MLSIQSKLCKLYSSYLLWVWQSIQYRRKCKYDHENTPLKGFFSEHVTFKRIAAVPLKQQRITLTYLRFNVGGGGVVRVRVSVKHLWWSFFGKSCRKASTLMFLLIFETIRCEAYYKTALVRGRYLFQS